MKSGLSQRVHHLVRDPIQLPLQLRLRADRVHQLIGPEMADLRHHRRDGAEHGSRQGHEAIVHEIIPPRAVAEPTLHPLPQSRAFHLVLPRDHAQLVVRFVEVEVAGEEDEADQAEGPIEPKGPEEEGVSDHGGNVGGVDDGGEEGDGEVGGEEVGFVETVEEDDEAHFAEGGALRAIDVLVDVGGSEVVEVRVVDPPGNTVRGAARKISIGQKTDDSAGHTRMRETANSIASRRSSSTRCAAPVPPHILCPENPTYASSPACIELAGSSLHLSTPSNHC